MFISCSICCEDINFVDQQISSTICGHLFHYACLKKWLENNSTCPECRVKINKNTFVKKLYANTNKSNSVVYKDFSDETKNIFNNFDDQTKKMKEAFAKRISFLEKENSKLTNDLKRSIEDKNAATKEVLRLERSASVAYVLARCQENRFTVLKNKNNSIQADLIRFLKTTRFQKVDSEKFGSSNEKNFSLLKIQKELLVKKLSAVKDLLGDSNCLLSGKVRSPSNNRIISNDQHEQVKEILVRDNSKAVVYKYRLGEKVWKKGNFNKHEGFVYGMYEIDKVFYLVKSNGIADGSHKGMLFIFPPDLTFNVTCQFKNQILFFSDSDQAESRLYDVKKRVWRDSSVKSRHPKHSFAVEHLDKVWMIGGLKRDGLGATNRIEVYNPVADTQYPSHVKLIQARCHHRAVSYRGKLFVFGGHNEAEGALNTVEVLLPNANSFVMATPMPRARACFGCCRAGNLVYVIGGSDGRVSTRSVMVYDLDRDAWSEAADFPCDTHMSHTCALTSIFQDV